jgi:large subunit ribosomal protein L29
MSLTKIKEILSLDNNQIEQEILAAKKQLFDLRLRQATRQSFKPHSFRHTKHRLSQLLMVQRQRISTNETKD